MSGFPQLREAGWLYGQDPSLPLALVRLFERVDGSGWEIRLNDPASGLTQQAEYADEQQARAELARIYAEGEKGGEWRISRPDGY